MQIKVKGLNKSVPLDNNTLSILKDIDLTCNSGEIVSIVGESGSGKSTLLNILSLLDDCNSGEYYWDDKNIFKLSIKEKQNILKKNIGIVFQQYNLIPTMTCFENVKVPLYLNPNIKYQERASYVEEMLKRVGLIERKNSYPKTLSGGEQQRVSIARALINNPDVIFADEPTGNIDSENEKQILNLFREIANQGKVVIIVTHSEVVKSFSDKVYRIQDGMIAQEEMVK